MRLQPSRFAAHWAVPGMRYLRQADNGGRSSLPIRPRVSPRAPAGKCFGPSGHLSRDGRFGGPYIWSPPVYHERPLAGPYRRFSRRCDVYRDRDMALDDSRSKRCRRGLIRALRKTVRVSIFIAVAAHLLTYIAMTKRAPAQPERMLLLGVDFLLDILVALTLSIYLKKLAMRLPDESLAKEACSVFWGIAITVASMLGIALIVAIISSFDRTIATMILEPSIFLFLFALFVLAMMSLFVLWDFARRLK